VPFEGAADGLAAGSRAVAYLALSLLLGSGALTWARGAATRAVVPARIGPTGALLLCLAHAGRLLAQGLAIEEPGAWPGWDTLHLVAVQSRWGGPWRWQMGAALAVLAFQTLPGRGWGGAVRLAAALVAAATLPLSGHAAADPTAPLAAQALQAAHLAAAATWIGMLMLLVGRAPSSRLDDWTRLSSIALVCAPFVVLSGLARSWQMLGSVGELRSTPWGRLLLVKILVAAMVGGLGFLNWRRHLPEARRRGMPQAELTRTASVEVTLAVVVFLLTAVLVGLEHGAAH
jgi:putative copper resistance protein D